MLLLADSAAIAGGTPQIQFDAADLVACRDVGPPEPAAPGGVDDDERLIEGRFEISSLITQGSDQDVVHFLYRIEFPRGRMRVSDYLPKTQLADRLAGPVAVERNSEDALSIGGGITARHEGIAHTTANLSATKTKASRNSIRYEMLPPKELIAAAGTINRHHGVYFKLRPSRRTSLEGAKQFVCILRVPRSWRGEVARVRCQARVKNKSPLGASEIISTEMEFLVGLYAEGDTQARRAVLQLAGAEADVARRRQALDRRRSSYSAKVQRKVDSVGDAFVSLAPARLWAQLSGNAPLAEPPDPDELAVALRKAERRRDAAAKTLRQLNTLGGKG